MRFDLLTLFPRLFDGFLSESLVKSAIDRGLIGVHLHNMRDWATDKHATMDDTPYGGGAGMVLKVDRVVPCVEDVQSRDEPAGRLLMLTPQGRRLTQSVVEELASESRLVILCGRYEGFDDRVRQILRPDTISIGDFVLNGGEVAAMAIVEAVMRLLPGVLGDEASSRHDSFSLRSPSGERLLEEPQFTRPREYRGLGVPEVLVSGNHAAVAAWRESERKRI
ncbi:MAG: tRNA (guanosine(37)-N1)-methyltransferase TrmD [Thermoguttaceae bacterium]